MPTRDPSILRARLIAILLVVAAVALLLAACGGDDDTVDASSDDGDTAADVDDAPDEDAAEDSGDKQTPEPSSGGDICEVYPDYAMHTFELVAAFVSDDRAQVAATIDVVRADIETVEAAAPPEIRADLELVNSHVAELLTSLDVENYAAAAVGELAEESPEVEAAWDRIDDALVAECGPVG